MSRRDEVVETIGHALTNLRQDLSTALAASTQSYSSNTASSHSTAQPARASSSLTSSSSSIPRRLSNALVNLLDLPAPASSSSLSGSIPSTQGPTSLPSRGQPIRTNTPFASSSHEVYELPIESTTHSSTTNGSSLTPRPPDAEDGEELPSYSRRAPGIRRVVLPRARLHVLSSRSDKLRLELRAPGEAHIVLMQSNVGETVWLEGNLIVHLPTPEAVSHIRIRVKGVVRTLVLKVHGSGRHPITDEATIWEDSVDLFTPSQALASNESSDPTKLQGTFTFPFRLKIPAKVAGPPNAVSTPLRQARPTPPSFALVTELDDPRAWGKGAEWASCRYFVKVTMGRKGLMKLNDRFVVPLVYVPCHPEPEMSAMRTVALSQGRGTPGPMDDPTGWTGKKSRHEIKTGLFSHSTKAWFEVVLLVPAPSRFARMSVIPFAIKISSSDPNATTRFPLSSVKIMLVQRAYVGAQGLAGLHDVAMGEILIEEDGPSEGTPIRHAPDDAAVWSKRLKGEIKLTKAVSCGFRSINLAVQHLVVLYVRAAGTNECEVAVPVQIVSNPAVIPAQVVATSVVSQPPPTRVSASSSPIASLWIDQPPPPTGQVDSSTGTSADTFDLGLPPSYFDTVEGRV